MRIALTLTIGLALAAPARAHFTFILPGPAGREVRVVFNDKLEVDDRIPGDRLAATRLMAVAADGVRSPLAWTGEEHALRADLSEPRPALVGGVTTYGYAKSRHTGDKPVLVMYYPKAILRPPGETTGLRLGDEARFEIVPETTPDGLRLRVFRGDDPVAGAACTVLTKSGDPPRRGITDGNGAIPAEFSRPGCYGVWVKIIEPTPGEWEGKPYEEVHSFATLVFDVEEARP